mgnify:FL=1|tara:strand:+ start:3709 stop:4941 length:1233 start_codon:yes stop_codon:yes gene_type:complete
MITFRSYQEDIIEKGIDVLNKHKFVYLSMEVRTGKTLTALGICKKLGADSVLFVTKKKAMLSIESDYYQLNPDFDFKVINYESLHKVCVGGWDVIICDEAHGLGAFPKPSLRAKQIKTLVQKNNPYVILLSGTPTPESYSQMYHQVYGIPSNPFASYKTFYKFAHQYVNIKMKKINSRIYNDYTSGKQTILDAMQPYMISHTQKASGFQVQTNEEVLEVMMNDITYDITKRLKKTRVIQGEKEVILGDTPVKLMSKLHQLFSGTVKFESGNSQVTDHKKAEFIYNKFKGTKIGIFYKFKAELKALKEIYKDQLTTELKEFQETNKSIALQILSGREGISLKEATALVYYNIDFSATSYWQSRDRMTTKDRLYNKIYWVFSRGGIEKDIYKTVIKKKDYTLNHFKRNILSL